MQQCTWYKTVLFFSLVISLTRHGFFFSFKQSTEFCGKAVPENSRKINLRSLLITESHIQAELVYCE